jgi:hypothetical protein
MARELHNMSVSVLSTPLRGIVPPMVTPLCDDDVPRTQELQQRVLSLGRIYTVGRHASAVIKGLKCALSLLGICDDVLAEPFHRFFAPERKRVEEFLRAFDEMSDAGRRDLHATDLALTDVSNG